MNGLIRSRNPYTTGLRPKSFLAARVEMLKKEKMLKKVNKDAYPKYDLYSSEKVNK